MAKTSTTFFCQNCGAQSSKWVGKCSACGEWNTYVEEVVQRKSKTDHSPDWMNQDRNKPKSIDEISTAENKRINTNNDELNRVLGSGLVPGSVVLIGGEPGIGKSTLMLQIALNLKKFKTLYITGEESEQQIKMRAERIGVTNPNCFILTETSTHSIFSHIKQLLPEIVIVDSIQTLQSDLMESTPGSVSQVRQCTAELLKFAKQTSTPVILIGHITKDGTLAGPKILEHMVDTVLQFEGDRNHIYRILRTTKNRFGSTSELGIYEMRNNGLSEVSNPSEVLISHREEKMSGVAVSATIEGIRPMLIETQALVSTTAYGMPQRSSTGFDLRRLSMLLAVLEKKCGFKLSSKDVFLNITGGIKVDDPAIDLGVVCAILSSSEDIPLEQKVCFAAEIGLSGEIRPVNRIEQRISEAEKLGYEQIFISKYNLKGIDIKKYKIEIHPVKKIEDVFSILFG